MLTGRHGFSTATRRSSTSSTRCSTSTPSGSTRPATSRGGVRRVADLPARQPRLAPGPQRVLHQDSGFIDHVVNKKPEIVRVYLPPDANTLLSTMDHCLRTRHYVNVIVAGKQPAPQWLTMDEAMAHCARGLGSGTGPAADGDGEPDVVLACAATCPRSGARRRRPAAPHLPHVKVRLVNVVDLMRLQATRAPPRPVDPNSTRSSPRQPIIFAYHGYPWLIHRLTYRRTNHRNLHVRGYKEEGTTTTPFDMVMLNDLDRFHLVIDVIDRVPGLAARRAPAPTDGGHAAALPAATRASTARTPRTSPNGSGPDKTGGSPGCGRTPSGPPYRWTGGFLDPTSGGPSYGGFTGFHQPKRRRKVRRVLRSDRPRHPRPLAASPRLRQSRGGAPRPAG